MLKTLQKLTMVIALILVTSAVIGTAPSSATEFKSGMLVVKDPWARGTTKSGGAFMIIHNMGSEDELIGVRGDVANKVQLHKTVSEDGIMKMKHVNSIPVPAKGMAVLKPGSYHVMMMGLKKALEVGHTFPLTLVFKKAGELTIDVKVQKLGARTGHKMEHAD